MSLDELRPSLVLLDTTMPRLDGIAAIRRMRERDAGRAAAIVALTATSLQEDRDALLAAGADGFLLKPCREDELFGELRRLLGIEYRYAPERPRAGAARSSSPRSRRGAGTSCRRVFRRKSARRRTSPITTSCSSSWPSRTGVTE